MNRETYFKSLVDTLEKAVEETMKEYENFTETECDTDCEECPFVEDGSYEFEDMLYILKTEENVRFMCPMTFGDGEFIYLDKDTYNTPTIVKVGEYDQYSVYTPTTQEMFDYVWVLVD